MSACREVRARIDIVIPELYSQRRGEHHGHERMAPMEQSRMTNCMSRRMSREVLRWRIALTRPPLDKGSIQWPKSETLTR